MTEPQFNSWREQATHKALRIYPHRTLTQLCATHRNPESRRALKKIMREGGEFFGPSWLTSYFDLPEWVGRAILNENHP